MSEERIEKLRSYIEQARSAMKAGKYLATEKLASSGLRELLAQKSVGDKLFPKLVLVAIELYNLRGSSRCMLRKPRNMHDAEFDFEQATTLARKCLPTIKTQQHIANAHLNLAIIMIFSGDNPHDATLQLERATTLLRQCADPFAREANQLIKQTRERQLTHLRW